MGLPLRYHVLGEGQEAVPTPDDLPAGNSRSHLRSPSHMSTFLLILAITIQNCPQSLGVNLDNSAESPSKTDTLSVSVVSSVEKLLGPDPSTSVSQTSSIVRTNGNLDNIWDVLRVSESEIKLTNHTDVALIIGNTGSGKSTFAQYFAGDNTRLYSIKKGGDFLISDNNTRISDSTINSHTLVPELVVNEITNTAYYDCPGFSDTRSTSLDIASTYFTKKVIDHADAVKLIVVVSHPSVKFGVDRQSFMTLLKHLTTLIKDISKFQESICLIVTKVSNEYTENDEGVPILKSDDEMLGHIAEFLEGVKVDLAKRLSEATTSQNTNFYNSAIKLLDILLLKSDKRYIKLGIFRRPNKAGPIANIKLLQKSKQHMEKIIDYYTQFTYKSDSDFGYTISEESKNGIHSLVGIINEQLNSSVTDIGKEIKEHYRSKIDALSDDICKLSDQLNKDYIILSNRTQELSEVTNPQELLFKITNCTNILDITLSKDKLSILSKSNEYLEFLKVITNGTLNTRPSDWIIPLKNTEKYLSNVNNWYRFVIDLYFHLSSYDIQKDRTKYNVDQISEHNVVQFLDKLNMKTYYGFKDIIKDQVKLEALNHVLDITLKPNVETVCEADRLIIKGDYVKFSDIPLEKCGKLKSLEIYALNTVFVDKDLIFIGDQLQLTIISPKWYIINTRQINLDGVPGAEYSSRADDGEYWGASGKDGKPGLTGGPAGNLLAFGSEFINSKRLTITAIGGRGGSGQTGGDGVQGAQGDSPSIEKGLDGYSKEYVENSKLILLVYNKIKYYYRFYGKAGGRGGNGGDGGVGGEGGSGGHVRLYGKPHGIKVLSFKGQAGNVGKGGKGGYGGSYGDTILVEEKTHYVLFIPVNNYYDHILKRTSSNRRAPWGLKGKDGRDRGWIQVPDVEKFHNYYHSINYFKNYFILNLNNSFNKTGSSEFWDEFTNDVDIKGLYNTLGYVNEFHGLESQFYLLKNRVDLLSFYQSLLDRVSEYSKGTKNNEKSVECKQVLSYLYTSILCKISILKDKIESDLILDTDKYSSIISEIKEMANTINNNGIAKYNINYKNRIDQKVSEVKGFIERHITVEFKNINEEIDEKVDLLLAETIHLQQRGQEEKINVLIEKKQELENSLSLRLVSGILNGISQLLSIFTFGAEAFSEILQATNLVAETFNFDDNVDKPPHPTLSQITVGIKYLLGGKENSFIPSRDRNNVIQFLDQLLNISSQGIISHPDELRDTHNLITDITSNSKKESNLFLYGITEKLKGHLVRKEKELRVNSFRGEGVLQTLEKLMLACEVGQVSIPTYLKYKDDDEKINEMRNAIKRAENNVLQLKEYEKRIYKTMIPRLESIQNALLETESELESKSQAALLMSKWGAQSSIRDIKLEMQQFTMLFKVDENLAQCIDKLEETMNTLIIIYDRIQNYYDQKKLADYIEYVSSVDTNSINTNDTEFAKAINNLEVSIRSNVILNRYSIAINGFKQNIFPFADLYLEKFSLPSDLTTGTSRMDLVPQVIKQIETLQSDIEKYDTSVTIYDKYIFKGHFEPRKYNHTKPFFVWDGEEYEDTITKLLSGEEVWLTANVLKGINKNAIKFNYIDIHFKSANVTVQNDLDAILKSFKLQMTHFGNSYYKCNNDIFVMTSENQTILQTFEKDNNGHPVMRNKVYDKIMAGSPMLSPYAMWGLKLISRDTNESTFNQLAKYSTYVDLELIGHGQYVHSDYICSYNLQNYYKVYDTVND